MSKVLVVFLVLYPVAAFSFYSSPIVNAHSQFGCKDDLSEIRQIIKRSGIVYTLISSTYIGCDDFDAIDVQQKTLDMANSLEGRGGMLISTKINANKKNRSNYFELLNDSKNRYFEKSKGFAELIVQRAYHNHPLW